MLPPYDTRETLAALASVMARSIRATVIALGDSFHDVGGPERLGDDDARRSRALQAGRDWIWVTGNHDRDPAARASAASVVDEMALGALVLRHEPDAGAASRGRRPSASGRQGA